MHEDSFHRVLGFRVASYRAKEHEFPDNQFTVLRNPRIRW